MKIIEKEIENILEKTAKKLYNINNIVLPLVQVATNEKFGDFQTNFAMVNAKNMKRSPVEIANEIKDQIIENNIIDKIEIAGPGFLNIFIKKEYLAEKIKSVNIDKKYNFDFINTDGDVIIDYSSPNIAKRMHIGHLRSTVIGDAIKRMMKYVGYNVIADNHIGDWGTQFGKLIVGYRRWLNKENYKNNPIDELERIYVEFSKFSENDETLEEEARFELKKLHDNNIENTKLWEEFIKLSLEEYDKIYKKLDITFDTYFGESYYHKMMPKIIELLKDKKLAVESEGAQVVFFDEKDKLPPCIVQKKDGAFLYATSDIACIKFRNENYNLNKVIYVTDERQQDHFKQFFKITELLDWKIEKEHIWFGIMRFKDDVFSTRKGNVIRLEELLDEAKSRAKKIVEEKNPNLSEEEKDHIAEVVGTGAVKYADLSQNRMSPVIFEWDKILSFEGNTAPYLQYTYARIRSILRKANENGIVIDENSEIKIENDIEKVLSVHIMLLPNIVIKSVESYRPNILADYIFELAKKFNTFYNALPILKEDEYIMKSRLQIISATAKTIKESLDLLGIKTVERM